MTTRVVDVIPLHPQAQEFARELINDFAGSLILQAKLIAFRGRAEVVLRNDVQEALNAMTQERPQTWGRQLLMVLGGALVGAFIQGFVTALNQANTALIAVFTALGFVGMLLVFWGLRR